MCDAIGQPGKDVEDGMVVGGEDVANVGAIEDAFEGGKYANPYWWAVLGADESREVGQTDAITCR